jgi:2'-5' RNA ligase
MRRVFVALVPPVETASALCAAAKGAFEAQPDGWRFPAAQHLHLTLAFLGDIPEKRLDELASVLHEAAAASPAPVLRIQGVGAFPSWERPRVLWAGLSEADPSGKWARLSEQEDKAVWTTARSAPEVRTRGGGPLLGLQTKVAEVLRQAQFRFDDKGRFSPHLTVARPRAMRPKGARRGRGPGAPVPEPFRALELDLAWKPEAVLCIESRLGAASAQRYPVLSRHPLRPA